MLFLKKVNHRQEAPPDAYILYDLNGGIYWIAVQDFVNFTIEWMNLANPPAYTIDLTSTCTHAVIFDFDYSPPQQQNRSIAAVLSNVLPAIETVLKMTFLPAISNFTYIVALRDHHCGIHVHLPEIKVGHDDYILLCEYLQTKFRQAMQNNDTYKLDILMNAMLPGAAKPNTSSPYKPFRLVYVDERSTFTLNLVNISKEFEPLKKNFAIRKHNEKSVFRNLLNCSPNLLAGELKQLMMPVVPHDSNHTLSYATSIGKNPNGSSEWQDVASFTYKKTREPGYISKCKRFVFNNASLLKVYHHLKLNACNMIDFETNNHAMKMWYQRFGNVSALDNSHIPSLFRDVHEMLQFEHTKLADNPNPIKTLMQFREGYYFLPVFYALCHHYRMDSETMARELYALLDKEFHDLLGKIRAVHPKNFEYAMSDISLNTVHFCANNLYRDLPKTNRDKLKSIVDNNQRAILSVTTQDQMIQLVRSMQERHLPIRVLKLRNALKKPSRYIWNALTESWQEVNASSEISDHMHNLWSHVKQFLNEYKSSGGLGGPEDDLINKFNVMVVVSAIMSDTAMERRDIQMDTHKWFLRLNDVGVLDLLTGHIGGVVPEFFLSDRKIDLGIPRSVMMQLCRENSCSLYETLVNKRFFLRYLRALFRDEGPSLYETLLGMVVERDDLSKSMLHFYVNLCKCTSFDYELLMYMLDILASVFVGTNYERKFFVWKGLTRNGKSKLFELMGRVLGGYYHSIQSENLAPNHSANNATPELASTLFSCRMVTSEELEKRLDENRVKQITGNSFVAFRNMYEQNSGGIPTAKLFATTNNYPECKASEAFKDRVVAIPFDAEFVDNAPCKTSEQVEKNTFPKDVYVVEQSFRGCFFLLYYHLKRHMNMDDGLLHYRNEPEYVVEFTQDYLIHADIYVQFKLHMDVQLKPGYSTTMNDVKSAVRQFLKTTKNTSFHETDLFICFEKEFGDLRQTDCLMTSKGYTSILDAIEEQEEEEGVTEAKKPRYETSVVYYDGVIIKNLRRINLED